MLISKSIYFVLSLILLGATFAVVKLFYPQSETKIESKSALPEEQITYLVAKENIPEGMVIRAKSLQIATDQRQKVPNDAATDFSQCVGRVSGGIKEGQYLFVNRNSVTGVRKVDKFPMRTIVYAEGDIKEGEIVTDDKLQEKATTTASKFPLKDLIYCRCEAIGRKAKYGIQQGQIVTTHDLSDFKGYPDPTYNHSNCSKTRVLSAKCEIKLGMPLKPESVEIISVNPYEAPERYLEYSEKLDLRKTVQKISEGQVITEKMLEPKKYER